MYLRIEDVFSARFCNGEDWVDWPVIYKPRMPNGGYTREMCAVAPWGEKILMSYINDYMRRHRRVSR